MQDMKILVLVNSKDGGVLAERARSLFSQSESKMNIAFVYRKTNRLFAMSYFLAKILANWPDLIYILDTSIPGAFAGILAHIFFRRKIVVDTGDLAYELAKSSDRGGKFGQSLIYVAEHFSIKLSSLVIVRGSYHKTLLKKRGVRNVELIRDATWTERIEECDSNSPPNFENSKSQFVIGVVGSLIYNSKHDICYGWDLIECLPLLRRKIPCSAIVIGDGTGLTFLKSKTKELGVSDIVLFTGRVPYEDLRNYLKKFDIAISTQTNNDVGHVRTTSKLVEYMAAGCFVLASDVGEASLILPPIMRLPYVGMKDHEYPAKLAARIEYLYYHQEEMNNAATHVKLLAREQLDYRLAAQALVGYIRKLAD